MKGSASIRGMVVLLMFCAAGPLAAQKIYSPVGGSIYSGGPGDGPLSNTYNQSGLYAGFTSGVTDFDTYVAGNPLHNYVFAGHEWFSELGTRAAVVDYDLGSILSVSKLALWNEDASGIGLLSLFGSTNGSTFFQLAVGLVPSNNPVNVDYGPQVFDFGPHDLRYVRMGMANCPQPDGTDYTACAIGEVAFKAGPATETVPEPTSLVLLGTGLLGLGRAVRRRRQAA